MGAGRVGPPACEGAARTGAFAENVRAGPCSAGPTAARGSSDEGLEAKVKAAYIFNFLTFVEPEPDGGKVKAPPPRICVVGDDARPRSAPGLSAGRCRESRSTVVAAAAPREASVCRILVIGRSESARVPAALRALAGTRVLTVSDIPRFSRNGGVIGFITEGGRVRIEVSQEAARNAGLRVSAKLLEIARVVP